MGKDIHWYPGHMKKAQIEVQERLRIVDCVIELLDARIPVSSRNDKLYDLSKDKERLVVLTKSDLADSKVTEEWISYFKEQNFKCIFADLNNKADVKKIIAEASKCGEKKHEKEIRKGLKPSPIRAMIIGIPNVGKSTLINKIANRNAASTQNKPGHTKAQQWIKVNKDFELLDTPGILQSSYEEESKKINLALVGSINQDILPIDDLGDFLVVFLKNNYPELLKNRYDIADLELDAESLFIQIASRRGLLSGGKPDSHKARQTLLNEFKNGILGRSSLEWPKK